MEFQSPEMEEHVMPERLVVAVSSGLHAHRLDAGVEAFSVGVGLLEPEDVQDSLHAIHDQVGHLLHGIQV